jgi:hypothetical protein
MQYLISLKKQGKTKSEEAGKWREKLLQTEAVEERHGTFTGIEKHSN